MIKSSNLEQMQQIVDMKYRQQQESFGRLLLQESKLRNSLAELDLKMRESLKFDDTPQRALGADVLWQAWIGRKRRELNMQLAQVLAVKERHIAQVRRAYGKVIVTQALSDRLEKQRRKDTARSQLDRAMTAMLLVKAQ